MGFFAPQRKFFKAAENGDVTALNQCLNEEVPSLYALDVRDGSGKTALIRAAYYGKVDTMKILLDKKAGIDVADNVGGTALFWAVRNGHTEAAKLMIAAGADVNAHDSDYYYPAHWAACNGDLDTVKALAAGGADLSVVNKTYLQTPLHMAIDYNRNPVVEFLLTQGVRLDLRDSNGTTPQERATSGGSKPLQEMFENALKRAVPPAENPAALAAPVVPVRKPEASGETWTVLAPDKVARIGNYPPIGRKITEIFNFESKERVIISENLKTGAETMGQPEKFATLDADVVQRAADALKALNGASPPKTFTL